MPGAFLPSALRSLQYPDVYKRQAQKEEIVRNVAARLSLEVEDFYNNIGYGGLSVSKLTTKLRDEFTRVVNPSEAAAKQPEKTVRPDRKAEDRSQSVILDGLEGLSLIHIWSIHPKPSLSKARRGRSTPFRARTRPLRSGRSVLRSLRLLRSSCIMRMVKKSTIRM